MELKSGGLRREMSAVLKGFSSDVRKKKKEASNTFASHSVNLLQVVSAFQCDAFVCFSNVV